MKLINTLCFFLGASLLTGCGGGGSSDSSSNDSPNYSTTSSTGDYAVWAIDGDELSIEWQVIDDIGDVDHTFDIVATCGTASATTGIQSCTIDTAACTAGVGVCPMTLPSGDIDLLVVPDVAIFANDGDQLHVGVVRDEDGCSADISGDYSYMHLGHGQRDVFGLYRSDADFLNVTHIDYGAYSDDVPIIETSDQVVEYTTGTETEMFTDEGCADGLRQRSNTDIDLRLMATANGLFVLDLPSGSGGILAFKAENAASLEDFEDKVFGGVSFSTDGPGGAASEEYFSVDFADMVVSEEIDLSATGAGGTSDLTLMPLDGNNTAVTPAYPDFTLIAEDNSGMISATSNSLQADYNTPNDLPGFFKIDGDTGTGRHIVAAVTLNDKVIAIGAKYKFKDAPDINPATGVAYDEPDYYLVENWIMFEL